MSVNRIRLDESSRCGINGSRGCANSPAKDACDELWRAAGLERLPQLEDPHPHPLVGKFLRRLTCGKSLGQPTRGLRCGLGLPDECPRQPPIESGRAGWQSPPHVRRGIGDSRVRRTGRGRGPGRLQIG
jgi:hypothetical protein